jgi:selenium-binding protein 1
MVQLLAMPEWGDRLIFTSFQAGQVGLLDISNPNAFVQQGPVVDFGLNAGPHDLDLTEDDSRLVVTDYFLDEDDFGKVHGEGDHKVHVIRVTRDRLILDPRFDLDFNTAFAYPARPHGIAMK